MILSCLKKVAGGVELFVLVQPRTSRNRLVGLHGDELKVALTAPPVDGAANKACCAYLAKLCSLPKSCVKITSGETSRHKRLLLEGADIKTINTLLSSLLKA